MPGVCRSVMRNVQRFDIHHKQIDCGDHIFPEKIVNKFEMSCVDSKVDGITNNSII